MKKILCLSNLRKIGVISAMVVTLVSCKESPLYFADSLQVYKADAIEKIDVSGQTVIDEAIGAFSLNVVDTVICLSDRQRNEMFSLYNINGDSLATVGVLGQGPSDFTSNSQNKQYVLTPNMAGTWVVDINSTSLKLLDLTASIDTGKSVVDSIVPIRAMVSKAFLVKDTLIQEVFGEQNFNLTLSSLDGKWSVEEPLYRHMLPASELFMFYLGKMGVSPDGKFLVNVMSSINQVNILTLNNERKRISVSVGGVEAPEKVIDAETHVPVHTFYTGVALSNDKIYALYENRPFMASDDDEVKNSEIHVMDYTGKVVGIMLLDRMCDELAYSSRDKAIYVIDHNEAVVRYPIPESMQ